MNRIVSASEQMREALSSLQHHWEKSCSAWNDSNQRSFGRDYMEVYPRTVHPFLKKLDQYAKMIDQARREVE